MKNFFLLLFFLLTTSCAEMIEDIGCSTPSYLEQETAKSLYNDFFSSYAFSTQILEMLTEERMVLKREKATEATKKEGGNGSLQEVGKE